MSRERLEGGEVASNAQSTMALGRLAFRLVIVLVLSVLWPGDAPNVAAGILCVLLAVGGAGVAWASGEKAVGAGLNRWHEAVFLSGLGGNTLNIRAS